MFRTRRRLPFFIVLGTVTWLHAVATQTQPKASDTFYFETLGYTETWLNLTPPAAAGDTVSPVGLNVTIRYRGKPSEAPLTAAPLALTIRAQSNPQYKPTFLRQPIFSLYADNEPLWDPSLRVEFHALGAPCDGCAMSTEVVQVTVPSDVLRRIGKAREVSGNAFGFTFTIPEEQRNAIARLADRVLGDSP